MRKILLYILLCGSCLFLSGCKKEETPEMPLCRVVTQIQVTTISEGQITETVFVQNEAMVALLQYLRLLELGGKTNIQPETFRADSYEIILTHSDGNHTIYRQLDNGFLQTDDGPWKTIPPALGDTLPTLLQQLTVSEA